MFYSDKDFDLKGKRIFWHDLGFMGAALPIYRRKKGKTCFLGEDRQLVSVSNKNSRFIIPIHEFGADVDGHAEGSLEECEEKIRGQVQTVCDMFTTKVFHYVFHSYCFSATNTGWHWSLKAGFFGSREI